jgi:hypothetical protein
VISGPSESTVKLSASHVKEICYFARPGESGQSDPNFEVPSEEQFSTELRVIAQPEDVELKFLESHVMLSPALALIVSRRRSALEVGVPDLGKQRLCPAK